MSNILTHTFQNGAVEQFIPIKKSAAAHNAIYRGENLTEYFDSGEMSAAIADGSFKDIFIGDYIIKTIDLPAITYTDKAGTEKTQAAQTYANVKWLVGALDPHLHCGEIEVTTAHHVLLIPNTTLQRSVGMNPTGDTTGGYLGSDMWNVHMPIWSAAIKSAFGAEHVLKHKERLTNAISPTAPSASGTNWIGTSIAAAWVDVDVNIPNEAMIYNRAFSSSGFDAGDFPRMLPLFALKSGHQDDNTWFWLRDVSFNIAFCFAGSDGCSLCYDASLSVGNGGIRPYFLLK